MNVSIDTSEGGQPEKASQLVVNCQSGQIVTVKRFSTNNLGSKLRAWARFTHTGDEFGAGAIDRCPCESRCHGAGVDGAVDGWPKSSCGCGKSVFEIICAGTSIEYARVMQPGAVQISGRRLD